MPDYQYNFVKLGEYADSRVAHLAVLWPAIGQIAAGGQLNALSGLLLLWRSRVRELGYKGWSRLAKPLRVQYTRNCLPTMAEVIEATGIKLGKECKLRDICPWCFSRRVKAIFKKVKDHISDDDKLVYLRSEHTEKYVNVPTKIELKELLSKCRNTMSKLSLGNSKTSQGIYWMVTLSPEPKNGSAVVVGCGLLAIMHKQESFDLVPDNWTVEEYMPPVRVDNMVEAVSRAIHYPVGLLKGPSELTIAIMDARNRLRLTDSYGCFRGV